MARTPRESVITDTPETLAAARAITPGLAAVAAEADAVRANVMALADQLGYDGSLTVGALEDEIRFYQRRSVEAVLALGTRLLLLKEMTAQGEFVRRVELLGINKRMAQRFMSATVKFGKSDTKSLLSAAGNQTKLLELVMLDDDELAELAAGGSVANLTLDDVERMTVTELRSALRDARATGEAKDRLLAEKNTKLDELAAQAHTPRKSAVRDAEWPETIDGLKDDAHGIGKIMDEILAKHLLLIDATEVVYGQIDEESPLMEAYKGVVFRLGEQIDRLCTLAAGVRNQYQLKLAGYVDLDRTYIIPDDQAE